MCILLFVFITKNKVLIKVGEETSLPMDDSLDDGYDDIFSSPTLNDSLQKIY